MENRQPRKNNSQTRCKKHPKHQQSPGVCSICLRERLSQISTTSSRSKTRPLDSYYSSSYLSSLSYSSSELSPVHSRPARSVSGAKWSKNVVLGKSRSMAFVVEGEGGEGKKKGGFWSKLLRPRSHKKNTDGVLVHSRTTRERFITTRVH